MGHTTYMFAIPIPSIKPPTTEEMWGNGIVERGAQVGGIEKWRWGTFYSIVLPVLPAVSDCGSETVRSI